MDDEVEPRACPGGSTCRMRVIFFGTSAFAVPSLEQVVAHHYDVMLCVTQPDRPQGRGRVPDASAIKRAAVRFGLPLAQPARLTREVIALHEADVGIVVAYGQVIRREVLKMPRYGMVGVHPSLLPRYRGAAPLAWALLHGETQTGVTIFKLDEQLDAGPIILRETVPIDTGDTAETLGTRLAQRGAELLVRALEDLAEHRATFTPQDDAQASFAPKLTKAQGHLDWRQPADRLSRVVRATIPWPGATTQWRDEPLKIWAATAGTSAGVAVGTVPGHVVAVSPEGITVATGQGTLVVTEVQRPGRRRMHVREFLAGHPLRPGDRLGNK